MVEFDSREPCGRHDILDNEFGVNLNTPAMSPFKACPKNCTCCVGTEDRLSIVEMDISREFECLHMHTCVCVCVCLCTRVHAWKKGCAFVCTCV